MYVYELTTGTAGEAAVMVEATHSLAGLVGSIHRLVALHTDSWNTTQHMSKSESHRKSHTFKSLTKLDSTHPDVVTTSINTESNTKSEI